MFTLIGFTAGTFTAGNVFTAQLSDATGSFDNPVVLGSIEATTSDIISATMPAMPYGTQYRIRVVSSDPVSNGADNGEDLTLGDNVPPGLTVQNLSIELDASGNATITPVEVVNSATDNCYLADTVLSRSTFDCADLGLVSVDVTLTDISGSSIIETVEVTVIDAASPVADAASLLELTGECSVDSPAAPTALDACAGAITGTSDVTFPVTTQGLTVITWTYDENENSFVCSFTVTYAPVGDVIVIEEDGVLSVSNEGTYQWMNCEAISDCVAFVMSGIHMTQLESSLKAYPNPTRSMLTIDMGQECTDVKINILSVNGQVVMVKKFDKVAQTELNMSNLIEGVYMVLVSSNQGTANTRIIEEAFLC